MKNMKRQKLSYKMPSLVFSPVVFLRWFQADILIAFSIFSPQQFHCLSVS